MSFLGEVRQDTCDHGDRTEERLVFEPVIKNLNSYAEPCALCADSECPAGGAPRLIAYRTRAGQVAATYGHDDVEMNYVPHGIDLSCADPAGDGVWVWDFCRDDQESIDQACRNLAHIIEHLEAQGITASPGPAFADECCLALGSSDLLVHTWSHPERQGIELFEAFRCRSCADDRVGRYRDAWARTQRLEDLVLTVQVQQSRRKYGEPLDEPSFRRRDPDAARQLQCLLSVDSIPAGGPADLLRTFFGEALRLLDEFYLFTMLSATGDGHLPHQVKGVPGTPAGILQTAAWAERLGTTGPRLTSQAWQELLDGFSSPPAQAKMWCGEISEYGWAQTITQKPQLVATSTFLERDLSALSLRLSFHEHELDSQTFHDKLLQIMRRLAEGLELSYAEVGYQPSSWLAEFQQTMLERLLYRNPRDTIPAARATLRGYSWLTVCAREIGDSLGGVPALRATGAFHEVTQLAYGGYWLQATEHYQQYDADSARRVFAALAAALPPGKPGSSYGEPHLIVPEDAGLAGLSR
jgi:hypothetical protein